MAVRAQQTPPRRCLVRRPAGASLFFVALLALAGCGGIRPPAGVDPVKVRMTVTGYCDCGDCCGWERSWLRLGTPVYSYGPNKGKPKAVGVTSTGGETRHGTAAVDRRRFPYGTVFRVPGYGYAIAEDTGGAIKGNHIDLWFPTHDAARRWGRRTLTVTGWPARGGAGPRIGPFSARGRSDSLRIVPQAIVERRFYGLLRGCEKKV